MVDYKDMFFKSFIYIGEPYGIHIVSKGKDEVVLCLNLLYVLLLKKVKTKVKSHVRKRNKMNKVVFFNWREIRNLIWIKIFDYEAYII